MEPYKSLCTNFHLSKHTFSIKNGSVHRALPMFINGSSIGAYFHLTFCFSMCPVDAPAAENLTVVFEEIAGRRDFLQQARIFVSWDAPYGQWNQGKMGVVAGLVPLCTGPSHYYAVREDMLSYGSCNSLVPSAP
jgi:hypothetical protein